MKLAIKAGDGMLFDVDGTEELQDWDLSRVYAQTLLCENISTEIERIKKHEGLRS